MNWRWKIKNIRDVAKAAGVSIATVSRVINNSGNVSSGKINLVNDAIESLKYEPNIAARKLRNQNKLETGVILAVIPNITNPFYNKILLGISDVGLQLGMRVLVGNTNNNKDIEMQYMEMLASHKADGAIVMSTPCNSEYISELANRFSIVQCAEYSIKYPLSCISIDNYLAARTAVKHLTDLGHERIAYIGADNLFISTKERYRGYSDELRANGIEPDANICLCADANYGYDSAVKTAKKLLTQKERPTAVFAISDVIGFAVIQTARELGISVPDELSVIGFDNIELCKMSSPKLTTIDQPRYEIGRLAVQVLNNEIMKAEATKRVQIFVKHKLVIRESTKKLVNKG